MVPEPTNQSPRRLCLGKIATAHGIRGLVKLILHAENPQLLELGPVHTAADNGKNLTVKLKNPLGKFWLAEIEGVTDRNAAESLRNTELWIDRDRLPALPQNEYYYADLIGLKAQAQDGTDSGTILSVQNFGAGDLLEIQPHSGGSFYLPFTHDTIRAIDIANGTVIIDRPDEV